MDIPILWLIPHFLIKLIQITSYDHFQKLQMVVNFYQQLNKETISLLYVFFHPYRH